MRVARAAGARGAIAKELPARELLAAVYELAGGGACEPEPAPPGEVRFAPREREILRLVSAGLTNAEIGASLYLAPGTIKHHMLGLYDKLGAPNRAAAVHTARRLGILADGRRAVPRAGHEPVRVLVADPVDVRRAGVLLALQGRDVGGGERRRAHARGRARRRCGRRTSRSSRPVSWPRRAHGARTRRGTRRARRGAAAAACWPATSAGRRLPRRLLLRDDGTVERRPTRRRRRRLRA